MYKNYLKIAWRRIQQDPTTSIINIFGLALAIAITLLIGLYIRNELNYDKGFQTQDQICRVYRCYNDPTVGWVHSPQPLTELLVSEFPEIQSATGIQSMYESLLSVGEKKVYANRSMWVDSSFFSTVPFPFKLGDPATALEAPNTVVLSEAIAKALYGSENPINKTLLLDGADQVVVKGVIDDVGNTHLARDIYIRSSALAGGWLSNYFATYVRISPSADLATLSNKATLAIQPHLKKAQKELGNEQNMDFANWSFQPVSDIHLNSQKIGWEDPATGDMRYLYVFGAVAFLLLFLAIFNYTNLSLAQATKRAKEIGVRKVNGARQHQLQGQFLTEALLQSFLALGVGMLFTVGALPYFQQLMQIDLSLDSTALISFAPWVILGTLLVGLLAGSYPAFILGRLQPNLILQNKLPMFGGQLGLRNILVVGQFIIVATALIVITTIYQQVNYMLDYDVGFSGEQVVTIPLNQTQTSAKLKSLESSILSNPNIQSMALSSAVPGEGADGWTLFLNDQTQAIPMHVMQADAGMLETWEVDLKQGRNFSKDRPSDTLKFLVNQAFVDRYFSSEQMNTVSEKNVLESNIRFWGPDSVVHNIIGVVEDFYMAGVDKRIFPTVIYGSPFGNWTKASFKINTQNLPVTIQYLETLWQDLEPTHPMKYSFLDASFEEQYAAQFRLREGLLYATLLTLFIALLGLFGLASFIMQRRQKEIGIRKVLGASVLEIVYLLNHNFLKLVGIALLLAFPLGWSLTTIWLADYPVRIELSWWVFALVGLLLLVIALVTVSLQSIRAAVVNPVRSLRDE